LLPRNKEIKIYKTIILPNVYRGGENLYVKLREEHRLRAFESRVLRGAVGLKREEVTGDWRKLHKKELQNLYSNYQLQF
jgi:hypothetical protein